MCDPPAGGHGRFICLLFCISLLFWSRKGRMEGEEERGIFIIIAHKPVNFTVNSYQDNEGHGFLGSMGSFTTCRVLVGRPDAEIGIMRNQRI